MQAQILAKIHHKNLVSLIGYCRDRQYMALVYEYMSEGALHEHLRGMKITQTIELQAFNTINIYQYHLRGKSKNRPTNYQNHLLHIYCRER